MEAVSIFTESERPSTPMLVARDGSIDYFTQPFTYTRMSRLHEKAAPWVPERDSKALRERAQERYRRTRYHWRDSDCTSVGYDKRGWAAMDMVLDGYRFGRLPKSEKCPYCRKQFDNA